MRKVKQEEKDVTMKFYKVMVECNGCVHIFQTEEDYVEYIKKELND